MDETANDSDKQYHWGTLKSLVPYLWPRGKTGLKVRVVAAMTFLVAAKLLNVAVPFVYGRVVDALSPEGDLALVIPVGLILAYAGARIMVNSFSQLRDAVFSRVGQQALHRVSVTVFTHLHRLSLAFHLSRRTGGLSRIVERGTKAISSFLSYLLFAIVPTLLEVGMVTVAIWGKFNIWYALVTAFAVGVYVSFTFYFTEWRLRFRREMNEQDAKANTRAIDSLLNFETVKYFGNEHHEATRFDAAMSKYEDAAVKVETSLAALNIGQMVIIGICQGIIMFMAAFALRSGDISIGDFVLINTLMMQLFMPLNHLGWVYRQSKQSLVDMEKMFALLDERPDVADARHAHALVPRGGTVRFENVHFHYTPERPILKGISFEVPAGKSVGIVGPSGAGKSTISRLLFRFYDVTEGRILIDGQDVRDVTQASLRQAVGIVPQDTVLFNDTIRYNIRYGRPDASDEEVARAARAAHIDRLIAQLPKGYDSLVGERGLKLSGGEKQRVAIARTVLKDPPILILDEATSALDSETEAAIQKELNEVCTDRTALIIAHRLSTIVNASEILVLDEGEIVERGTHEALMARNGQYARMWRQQQKAAATLKELQALDEEEARHLVMENSDRADS